MYPEDRVLVVYVPHPKDFTLIQKEKWYRIPQKTAPKGLNSEYFAFYFGRHFSERKWAIHSYAPRLGHELTTRLALLPNESEHPRASDMYYKVQLGKLVWLPEPIISLQWRRLAFLHTTWDRFTSAREINDLLLNGTDYVNRHFSTLREQK